ncbi:MAG: response regulator transcription factor [Candidatus Geothermincolia bacterium]
MHIAREYNGYALKMTGLLMVTDPRTKAIMSLSRPKLLVIEDDQDILNIISMDLTDDGFEVSGCRRPIQGVKDCLTELPDAIIVDLLMPGMNGFEVLRELKANTVTKDIPAGRVADDFSIAGATNTTHSDGLLCS